MMISAGSGPVNVAQRYSNVKLFGVSKGKIEKAELVATFKGSDGYFTLVCFQD